MNKCLNCSTALPSKRKFCSNKCQGEYSSNIILDKWKSGLDTGYSGANLGLKQSVRNYILKKFNYSCRICGWNERHPIDNLPLVEVNHIDGDASNCSEDNLEVLCRNCHSMTPNFGSRNRSGKRAKKYFI